MTADYIRSTDLNAFLGIFKYYYKFQTYITLHHIATNRVHIYIGLPE